MAIDCSLYFKISFIERYSHEEVNIQHFDSECGADCAPLVFNGVLVNEDLNNWMIHEKQKDSSKRTEGVFAYLLRYP